MNRLSSFIAILASLLLAACGGAAPSSGMPVSPDGSGRSAAKSPGTIVWVPDGITLKVGGSTSVMLDYTEKDTVDFVNATCGGSIELKLLREKAKHKIRYATYKVHALSGPTQCTVSAYLSNDPSQPANLTIQIDPKR